MDLDRKRFMLFLPLLFAVILFGCDGSSSSDSSTPSQTPSAYTENDFVADASLRIPISQTAVTFLEPPNTVVEVDTHEPGADTVPYYFQEPGEYTFCWEGDIEGSQHYMYLQDSTGKEVLQVSVDEGCVTAPVGIGNYTMFIVHDGLTAEVQPIFLVTDSGDDDQSLQPQANPDEVKLLLSSNKCEHCDLKGADLQEADLSGADLFKADLVWADLKGVHLSGANLIVADLSWTDSYKADLSGADLTVARLVGADLPKANLSGANLFKAILFKANLSEANLSGAILKEANLQEANLQEANLSGADLKGAYLFKANLSGANLSGAIWVDGVMCAEGSIGECK